MKLSQILFEDTRYKVGFCDVAALALHQLTGLPLGLIGGDYEDDLFDEPAFEAAHACVILDNNRWADAYGIHTGIPDNLMFNNEVSNVRIEEVSEEDIRSAFTACDISQKEIDEAKRFVTNQEWFQKL